MQEKKIKLYAGIICMILIVGVFIMYHIWETQRASDNGGENILNKEIPSDIKEGEVYTHTDPAFSFHYPKGFQAGLNQNISAEGGGETIVVERGENESFQVAIAFFDEPGPITKERILRDLPDMLISEENSMLVIDGIHAFGFVSKDETVGETYEIWFVTDGQLFQISTPLSFKETLMDILTTWKFL